MSTSRTSPRDREDDDEQQQQRPSKTQLKKQMHELQELGEALMALSDDRLDGIPMPESLREAVRELRRTRSHEGRRRQLQYVGKLMRNAEVEPIREAIAASQLGRAKDTLTLHRAERWRTELIENDEALTRWMDQHAGTDVQALRSLIRAARKDAAVVPEQRSGRAYRELFQFVRQTLDDGQEQDHE